MAVDLRERQYISQFASDPFLLAVHVGGIPGDVDGNAISVTSINTDTDPATTAFSRTALHTDTGIYELIPTSVETSVPGNYTLTWAYSVSSSAQIYETYYYVGEAAPPYDNLVADMKSIVDSVWMRFSDMFDSPYGGPNLQTYFQSHFGRGRIAQLLRVAVGVLNTIAQPYSTYTVDGPGGFPVDKWGPLLEEALYIEVIKHLKRSYVEQPMFVGGAVTRLDRRDYFDRWNVILREEETQFKAQLDVFKIANMGLARPRVLVSGGVYGRYGPTRLPGSAAARPRMWTRWY